MYACDAAAASHLPHVRVLADSFLAHHPDGRFTLLAVDEPAPTQERFDVRPADADMRVCARRRWHSR